MKRRSFFVTLLLGNLLLIAVILGLGVWWTYREMRRQSDWNSRRFQEQLLSMVKDGLEEAWPKTGQLIEQYCRSYSKRPEFRLTVIDVDGRVLGDSEHPAERMSPHDNENHPEFLDALAGRLSETSRMSRTKKIRYRYVAAPILHDKRIVGAVRVAFPLSDLKEDRRRLFSGITVCFVLMLLASSVFFGLLSWLWSKPIKMISRTARQIAEGNLGPIPESGGSVEMIELHDAVDRMRRTVSRQLETITWQRERLQSILQHLPDAVFALDSQDRIVYYNEPAQILFHLEPFSAVQSVSHSIQHILRHSNLLDFYFERREKILRHESLHPITLEVKLGERKRTLEVELIDAFDERNDDDIDVLLIVTDLTDRILTERMKTDFVANTSHELRTPLTSIRMTLDNVLDGVYPAASHQEVFEMLNRNVHRLEALTDDLLALHGLEDDGESEQKESTTFEEQKRWLEELFMRTADDHKIEFHVEIPERESSFQVDTKRFALVVQNLVDNALKFTQPGGTVRLRLSKENDDTLVVQCEDDGCGIASEEQHRIFERFYRVKEKNGDKRGTGLGLSIVKHAVERLGGSLSLTSLPGSGSTFTVRIPVFFET